MYVDTPTGRRKWHLGSSASRAPPSICVDRSTDVPSQLLCVPDARRLHPSIPARAPRARLNAVAYFTGETLERLLTVDDVPELAAVRPLVPPGKYTTARLARQRTRHESATPALNFGVQEPRAPALPSLLDRQPLYTITQQGNLVAPHPPSDIRLPVLKPTPWGKPSWFEEEFAARQPELHRALNKHLRRNPHINLAPLIYMRKTPYPPRDVADDDILQRFDCEIL